MNSDDVIRALEGVGRSWTRQAKAEEKHPSAKTYRASMYASAARVPLKEICYSLMDQAWSQASDDGRLPTHWRQIFYTIRPLCDEHPDSDRPLIDKTFKSILDDYLDEYRPGWDVLRGARGVFKEPHRADDDNGLPLSTINVRSYLARPTPDPAIRPVAARFPTSGAINRIAAVLICEKEGFDELLVAERIPERYDLALLSTKGISAIAARDLAQQLGVPCFVLHDLDKNGFVMAAGFPSATDIGIRMDDVDQWQLRPETQTHRNPSATHRNLLHNGASHDEANFIAQGQRVELNMLTGPSFIAFVEQKLDEHGVTKVIPDTQTLEAAWRRANTVIKINRLVKAHQQVDGSAAPGDLSDRIRIQLADDPHQSWDAALWTIARLGAEDPDPSSPTRPKDEGDEQPAADSR
jgi:hypothetical protein